MKYKFVKLDLAEEVKAIIGDKPFKVTDSGNEIVFDFGDKVVLTSTEENTLINLMATKPLLRGKLAKFVKKGEKVEITGWIGISPYGK